jgi:hypothetical protein
VVDATGSMGDEMEFLKSELTDIVAATARANPGLQTRVGLTVYRDIGDEYVVRNFPLTGDVAALVRSLDAQSASGGGDYPEAVDQALESALQANWDPRAVKALVLVADAPPHDERAPAAWRNAMALRDQGVHIVPVAASGVGPAAEYLMRAMAAATQSRYLFLTDDSGVGNAHGEPAVDCYVVTRLDGLLRRVLTGLVVGRRIEPSPAEILRQVGDYDAASAAAPRSPASPARTAATCSSAGAVVRKGWRSAGRARARTKGPGGSAPGRAAGRPWLRIRRRRTAGCPPA